MLKFAIMNIDDLKEAAKLRRRQQYEDERKKRIFDAKQRLFGIDLDAIERQINEKRTRKDYEAECERRYVDQIKKQQHAVYAKQLEQETAKRLADSDINYYRCLYQRKDQRREFDLSDPDAIKKSKPARIADHDDRLGVSSAQIFHGEDLYSRDRRNLQREQQRAWLDQQVRERRQAEASKALADDKFQESLFSRDKRLEDMAKSERRVKDQIVNSIREYNFEMARQKRAAEERRKREKNEDDMAEIYNMLTSDMLTENPDVACSKTNPNQKVAILYRGMTPLELERFREEQHVQLLEYRKRKTEQAMMDKQWEQFSFNVDRELTLKARQLNRKRKDYIQQQLEINTELAREQRLQQEQNKKDSINVVSEEFFDQFNRDSR